jgi:O-antigen/teichoic acid export membrane protein
MPTDTSLPANGLNTPIAGPQSVGKIKRVGFTVIKNAASNLVRGGASAAVALALPHFLTRSLNADKFAAWSLILQIAAYAGYLDFGLQTAIARFLAQAIELNETERCKRLVSTAFGLLSLGALVAALILALVIVNQHLLFPGLPPSLTAEFQIAAAILAASAVLQLPLSTFGGILTGLHRNELPALAIGITRLFGAAAAIWASYHTSSLIMLASCVGIANLAGGLMQAFMASRLMPQLQIRVSLMGRAIASELTRYCVGLTVWSFSMLLVSGLDVTLVGYFTFSQVGYYSIAASLIALFAGFNNSALAALMTPIAALGARGENRRIAEIILYATRLNTAANLALTVFLFAFGYRLIEIWCGASYAQAAMPIVRILAIAQLTRLTMTAYSVALISTGQQNKAVVPALAEALVNLAFSVLGAVWLGPIGVALGTLAGAVCGILCYFMATMKTITGISIGRQQFLSCGSLPPLVAGLPLIAFVAWTSNEQVSLPLRAASFILSMLVSLVCFHFLSVRARILTARK